MNGHLEGLRFIIFRFIRLQRYITCHIYYNILLTPDRSLCETSWANPAVCFQMKWLGGGKLSFFFRSIVKFWFFIPQYHFLLSVNPSFSVKFSGKFSIYFQEFYRKFPSTPGVSPIPPHIPYPPYTYLHTYPHPHHSPSDWSEPITCRYFPFRSV